MYDPMPEEAAEPLWLLRAGESWQETLERVAATACATIPGCTAGSVTLWRADAPYTVASTDELARHVDDAQYEILEGPCLDASRYGTTYVVGEMARERRWPVFADVAARRGVRSSLSLPLVVRDTPIGALNLYSREPGAFTGAVEAGRAFAAEAGIAVANAEIYHQTRQLADQLQEAMSSRAVIEQAKGVLMAEQGCTAEAAFGLLRAASMRENVKIREIAKRIVDGQVGRRRADPLP